tara:strand:- start:9548 stop:10273 length:726 start_codon:yes stop_codon:yes gene_type:complete
LNNNDVLRRLRYTFNYNDKQMITVFASAGLQVSREQVSQWLKKDDDVNFVNCMDSQLAYFLNGFINEKRGKKEGPNPAAEKRLTNNIVLTKLKIALNLKAEELIELLETVGFRLNKPELSAFSRRTDHQHYRECKDQVLRNLLHAIDKKYHVARTSKFVKESVDTPKKTEHKTSDHKTAYKGKDKAKSISQKEEPYVEGARPNASAIYVNPKKQQSDQDKTKRGVLKLKPEDIYKQPSKKS